MPGSRPGRKTSVRASRANSAAAKAAACIMPATRAATSASPPLWAKTQTRAPPHVAMAVELGRVDCAHRHVSGPDGCAKKMTSGDPRAPLYRHRPSERRNLISALDDSRPPRAASVCHHGAGPEAGLSPPVHQRDEQDVGRSPRSLQPEEERLCHAAGHVHAQEHRRRRWAVRVHFTPSEGSLHCGFNARPVCASALSIPSARSSAAREPAPRQPGSCCAPRRAARAPFRLPSTGHAPGCRRRASRSPSSACPLVAAEPVPAPCRAVAKSSSRTPGPASAPSGQHAAQPVSPRQKLCGQRPRQPGHNVHAGTPRAAGGPSRRRQRRGKIPQLAGGARVLPCRPRAGRARTRRPRG